MKWIKLFGDLEPKKTSVDHEAKHRRLKHELARLTEERDVPEKGNLVLRAECKVKYSLISERLEQFRI